MDVEMTVCMTLPERKHRPPRVPSCMPGVVPVDACVHRSTSIQRVDAAAIYRACLNSCRAYNLLHKVALTHTLAEGTYTLQPGPVGTAARHPNVTARAPSCAPRVSVKESITAPSDERSVRHTSSVGELKVTEEMP
jgi:hypothetical protein